VDPYRIMVSEVMLQQTGVERVRGKYEEFLETFPSVRELSRASVSQVLRVWKGLGYNRRALSLREAAQTIVARFGGSVPRSVAELSDLPGIGKATASAILAFAFDMPVPFIETNVRRVFLHFFFPGATGVKDREILPLVGETMDRRNPREWFYALMDYGTMLRSAGPNPNKGSAVYRRQPPFEGSLRQARGRILELLLARPKASLRAIAGALGIEEERVRLIVNALQEEGFLTRTHRTYRLA
jgi:A/G-specific adenine glycosylase